MIMKRQQTLAPSIKKSLIFLDFIRSSFSFIRLLMQERPYGFVLEVWLNTI